MDTHKKQQSEERFWQIINSLNDILIMLDKDLRIRVLNKSALQTYDVTRDDYVGMPCHEVLWDCDQICENCPVLEVIQHGTVVKAKRYRDDGTILDRTIYPVQDQHGSITGCTIIAADITEQERYVTKLQRYKQIISTTADMVAFLDEKHSYLAVNSNYARKYSSSEDMLIGETAAQVMDPEVYHLYLHTVQQVLEQKKAVVVYHDERQGTGIRRKLKSTLIPYRETNGQINGIVLRTKDVTEEHEQQSKLRLYAQVFENTAEAIIITNPENRTVAVNAAFAEITGYTEAEILGKSPAMLQSGRHNRTFYAEMWSRLKKHGFWHGEIWNRRKNGEIYPVYLKISAVIDNGVIVNHVGVFSDLTPIHRHAQELEYHAHHHPLTKMPNRRALNSSLAAAVEETLEQRVFCAILYIDLDNFKKINDSLGHQAGDRVLVEVAELLQGCKGKEQHVFHIGADEFVAILNKNCNINCAIELAEKIIANLQQPFYSNGYELFLSASIGIAEAGAEVHDHKELLKNADLAMYHAKNLGKNTYSIYTPELTCAALKRVKLESSLRKAIEKDEFKVYFQPQIELAGKTIVAAEALVRWEHPREGLIMPDVFIPISEETGMIIQIGAFVLESACRQFVAWRNSGYPIQRIAVNISGSQIQRRDLPATVARILRETGCPPECLELEITESFIMKHPHESIELLHRICDLGVTFSIDDFGTGHSSLSYLKKLPVKRLKIDRSFVWDINTNADGEQLTRAVIAIGRSLNLQITAEGVENSAQLNFLEQEQCNEVQGYLFSRPVTAEQFTALLQQANNSAPNAQP